MRLNFITAILLSLYITGSLSKKKPATKIVPDGLVYPLGVLPPNTLTHFAIITSWENFNTTLSTYGTFLGLQPPNPNQIAGGPDSNGTYVVDGVPQRLLGTTKIAFLRLNNNTQMEFLAGDPDVPSWWRDVYLVKGFEVHHMGYHLATNVSIWPVVEAFTAAQLGAPVQWGRWGVEDTNSGGCYVYIDSQSSLGVTTEILGAESGCDSLPAQPRQHT